jgi:cobalt-zinc-cadmium efflux system protein
MAHTHHHHEAHRSSVSRKLMISAMATVAFVVVQVAVGYFANSLAVLGDAVHNLTDGVALVLALVAVRVAKRAPTDQKSYGYHRAGILAAFVNGALLVAFTIFIFVEAVERFRTPHPVNDVAMIIVAAAGIALNFAISFSLREEGKTDVNVRSAVVHMFGDTISSAGIIVAAILIRVTGALYWDAVVSIFIGVLILWSSWDILRETVNLLLEGTPSGIDPDAVARSLAAMEGVNGVHHLHIWALGPSLPALSCHLMVGDVPVRSTGTLLDQVRRMLAKEYSIAHATIQFEFAGCDPNDPYCVPYPAAVTGRQSSPGR